ncbi:MAG: hypothetical protein J7K96_06615 [Desulfobacteraceae bacterium]|nr:hypothetical protein [Desulfobacteraceae bacterium]
MIPKKPKIKNYMPSLSHEDREDKLQKFITAGTGNGVKKKYDGKKTSLLVQLQPEVHTAVKMAAAAEGRSVRKLVTDALLNYLIENHDIHFQF